MLKPDIHTIKGRTFVEGGLNRPLPKTAPFEDVPTFDAEGKHVMYYRARAVALRGQAAGRWSGGFRCGILSLRAAARTRRAGGLR